MNKATIIYLGRRGGGQMYAYEMAKSISKYLQIQCIISEYTESLHLWTDLEESQSNVELVIVPTYRDIKSFIFNSLNFYKYYKIRRSINRFNPDFIYSPMNHPWERFIVPYLHNKLTISTIHDLKPHDGEDSLIHKIFIKLFKYNSKYKIVLSKIYKDKLISEGYNNVIWIPHASFGSCYSSHINFERTLFKEILFFGRIHRYKGINILLKAMKVVVTQLPEIKLHIVGQGDMSELKSDIEAISSNVIIENHWIPDDEVCNYFNGIDLIICPYIDGSQSGVIPLAYSFGKPVIATKSGGLSEQIIPNQTGILVEPNNVNELANAIINIYNHPEQLVFMKECCFEYASNNSWDKSAKILLEALVRNNT